MHFNITMYIIKFPIDRALNGYLNILMNFEKDCITIEK
jgi:hypothetical protein